MYAPRCKWVKSVPYHYTLSILEAGAKKQIFYLLNIDVQYIFLKLLTLNYHAMIYEWASYTYLFTLYLISPARERDLSSEKL